MGTKARREELSTEINHLRQQVDQVIKKAQSLVDRHEKNTDLGDCLLFLQRALSCLNDEDDQLPEQLGKVDWVAFGKTLKRQRTQAKLGIKELADLVDVSDSMIRHIESAEKRPGARLLLRLLALAPLNLRPEDLHSESSQPGVVPTIWAAPHYEPRQLIAELVDRLNGSGCALEQTTAYLDYQSASDWLATCNAPNYLAAFSNTSALEAAAARIADQCGAGGIDLIAIGCGDAKREVKLAECLLAHTARRNIQDIRVFLLDISHSLLTEGHNHAKAALGHSVKSILALHGNFHELSQYPLFNRSDRRTRSRVFTLLGCTLANLDNEVRFFRDTMSAASPGDFFLADYTNAYAPPEEPEKIRALDPAFQASMRESHKMWLGGPIYRYCRGARAIDFALEVSTDCIVRGSYELTYVAHVTMEKDMPKRRFVVQRVRRYDSELLEDCLARTGWAQVMRSPYGGNDQSNLTLLLLRKASSADD